MRGQQELRAPRDGRRQGVAVSPRVLLKSSPQVLINVSGSSSSHKLGPTSAFDLGTHTDTLSSSHVVEFVFACPPLKPCLLPDLDGGPHGCDDRGWYNG